MATYNKKIEIQKLAVTSDAIGNQIEDWETVVNAWCSASSNMGREFNEASQPNSESEIVFKMLYSRTIHKMKTSDARILYDGGIYDVKSITDYREKRRMLEIKAVAVNDGA